MKSFVSSLILFTLLTPTLFAQESEPIVKYYEKLKIYREQLCPIETEEEFAKLYRAFRGSGHYVPILPNATLDRATLVKYLPEILQKKLWIAEQAKILSSTQNFPIIIKQLDLFEKKVRVLLKHKEENFFNPVPIKKRELYAKEYKAFQAEFSSFLTKEIPFMLGYQFPVSHEELRRKNDFFSSQTEIFQKKEANDVYLFRKLVEDGAQNPDHSSSDAFLRTAINTTVLRFQKESEFISDESQADLLYVLRSLKAELKRGKERLGDRLEEWETRIGSLYDFYQTLVDNHVKQDGKIIDANELAMQKSKASNALKEFVLNKQEESYAYWAKESEEMQAFFAIDNILLHEVGSVGRGGDDQRYQVTGVAYNRSKLDEYSLLTQKDDIFSKLRSELKKDHAKYRWLNLLLKKGEFSFTYFFIPASLRILCPEMVGPAKTLRRENLQMAKQLLKSDSHPFKGVRYFSRVSMLGRYSMGPIWDKFEPIPESPGESIKSAALSNLLKRGHFLFLNNFDFSGKSYFVFEARGKKYVATKDRKQIYHYQNPHLFKFFEVKN